LGTNNQLTNLDVSNNPLLTDLRCGGIQLENLDVSNNPLLTGLRVGNNALTSLDVSNNTNLMTLVCSVNLITDLDVGNNPLLTDLRCGDNELFSLEISNNMLLETLGCANNQITGDLFEIVDLDSLTTLRIENNQFSGEIPETICDLNINFSDSLTFNISNNSFCPPYPSCVNDYVGEQDTTNCGQVSITDETFPLIYKLQNAYPNPFNPVTTLSYDLPEDALVNVTIYDMVGRQVSTLISSQQSAGYKSIQWNATNSAGQPVSAGLYLYTIQAGEFRETKKMVLLK
jgi:Leucine-rich repeat (LRR) protein